MKPVPQTQKATSIFRLTRMNQGGGGFLSYGFIKGPGVFMYSDKNFPMVPRRDEPRISMWPQEPAWFPCFARPCPSRPKHGFVRSREITTSGITFLSKMYREALQADAGAEMILMDKLSGQWSAVATAAGITWGRGHDGATDARNYSAVHLPARTGSMSWNHLFGEPSSMGIEQMGYLELVEDKGDIRAVQFRDGPEPPISADYIPHEIEAIEEVVQLGYFSPDEIERFLRDTPPSPSVVFYLRNGTMSCHQAVSVIAAGYALITSFEPEEGRKIGPDMVNAGYEPNYGDLKRLAHQCLGMLLRGHGGGLPLDTPLTSTLTEPEIFNRSVIAAAGIIQSCGQWPYNQFGLLTLRAFAVTTLIRYVIASCVGEARYFDRQGPGREDASEPREPALDLRQVLASREPDRTSEACRASVAKPVLTLPVEDLWLAGIGAGADLALPGWRKGYGGESWRAGCHSAVNSLAELIKFIREPSEERWSEVHRSANTLLNVVHNGGRILSKWVANSSLDYISNRGAVFGLMSPVVPAIGLAPYQFPMYMDAEEHLGHMYQIVDQWEVPPVNEGYEHDLDPGEEPSDDDEEDEEVFGDHD